MIFHIILIAIYDFDKAEVEYQALVLDGKTQEAATLRKDIRAAERDSLRQEMQEDVTQTVSANQEQAETQKLAAQIEAEFTVFDQNHEDFNESYAQEVIALRDGYIQHNLSGPEALRKAADMVIKNYDLQIIIAIVCSALIATVVPAIQVYKSTIRDGLSVKS